ncbi:cell division protein FtsI (penicillin-binding protein 3) [Roseomonas rosea]|uniref:Cell division protein FtsI (Penicillin-binding protein 3) n=1 Tax=Muricoccus roseus TaxID=198092 RepID=A0A1M6PLI4_9PROT|nr:penicillin-binding protein 2 [Roseomonas rosea]SHK08763.1 cell division protein FtsI (penicillin-binding protein 3) [Roseomonas rosea]
MIEPSAPDPNATIAYHLREPVRASRLGDPRTAARTGQPDLARRAVLEKSRGRLVLAAAGFGLLFGAVALKATIATVIDPREPRRIAQPRSTATPSAEPVTGRAPITDRNGEILAVSLPVTALYANPRQVENPAEVAQRLARVLPQLDASRLVGRLSGERQFSYLARALTPREKQAVNDLGIAGLHFEEGERRYYPQGRAAVHVLGNVDVDGAGLSGMERYHDERLRARPHDPLRTSIDIRVQLALRDAVAKAIDDYTGIGGAGVVLDINTGEIMAMVSLPDYDAGDIGAATTEQRFNRVTVGTYEPGSTFKLLTAAAALEFGTANVNTSSFNASSPIRYGRFTISDYKGKGRWLTFPEVLAYSSNLGAAHMAQGFGPQRQREFMQRMGMLSRIGVEITETALPLVPPANGWRDINMLTIAFGHGISVTPLHVVSGVAAIANGGILRQPTLLAQPPGTVREGTRVVSERTSETMRRLMRLVVTDGSGKGADVPGYFVGGKTGTAQKTGPRGGYLPNKRIAAFVGAFPMNAPRYAVYVMVDEPNPNARSHGYATAGWVAAPAAGSVIARIAPVLGLVPENPQEPSILQAVGIPLQPGRPGPRPATASAPAARPGTTAAPPASPTRPATTPAIAPRPATPQPVPSTPTLAPPVPLRVTELDQMREQSVSRIRFSMAAQAATLTRPESHEAR